ncbi:MAG TPA: hypothetical protein VHG30_13520 [Microvirga sp.]|nr:hypothetical protein [Microvirga sp.]
MSANLDILDRLDFAPADPLEEDQFLGNIVSGIGSALGGLLGEEEDESFDFEDPLDMEAESILGESLPNPDSAKAAVLMELMVDQLAEAEGEGEADQFLPILGALAPLALKALPAVAKVAAPVAKKVLPHLARGVVNVGRQILRSPHSKQLLRTLPTVARNTASDVLRTYAQTGQVNGDVVKRAAARQAAKVLRVPANRRRVIRRNYRICGRVYPAAGVARFA